MKNRFGDAVTFSLVIAVPAFCALYKTNLVIRVFATIIIIAILWILLSLYDHILVLKQIRRNAWCNKNLEYNYIKSLNLKFVDKEQQLNNAVDKKYIVNIINEFKAYMQSTFFNNTTIDKKLLSLSDEEFILLYFYSYLCNVNLIEANLNGEKLLKYSHKENYTTVYCLTNYGYSFYKLLYSLQLYCQQSEKIMKSGKCSINIYNTQKVLDKGIYIAYSY